MRIWLLSLNLVLAPLAWADNCENPRNAYDAVHCEQKIYNRADAELNKVYKKLIAKLDADGKDTLRAAQRGWIRERDGECTKQSTDVGPVIMTNCMTEKTVSRTHFLADRLRECETVGCINARLLPE